MDPLVPSTGVTPQARAMEQALANSARETAAQTTSRDGVISSDFETFLRMLTVQMQNQDPLNPVDSADYAVQLATFSSVEQQVLTNDLLSNLTATLGTSGLNALAAWVGQRALVDGPVQYEGTPLTVVAGTEDGVGQADLIVRDSQGRQLERRPFDVPGGEIDWTPVPGSPAGGQPVSFAVESFAQGQSLGVTPVQVYALVREVRSVDGLDSILVPGGTTVPADQITALRDAWSGPQINQATDR